MLTKCSSPIRHPAIQFARLSGFSTIIATASPQNTTLLKSLGATHVIDRKLPSEKIIEEVNSFLEASWDNFTAEFIVSIQSSTYNGDFFGVKHAKPKWNTAVNFFTKL